MSTPSVHIALPPNGAASWREPVNTATALPATASLGDERVAQDTGTNYVWSGSAWVAAGGGGGGSGTVTTLSIASANGFGGTVANPTTTPAVTLSTSVTGIILGNGTAISAATAGTDYSAGTAALGTGILKSTTVTGALSIAIASDFPTLNQNTSGNAATVTTNANLTGPITSSGNATSIASQTGTGTKFVMDTAPTIAGLLTQTGQYTNSFAGTASNPAMLFSGSPFSGGSGTTTRPAFLLEDNATPATTWQTGGTYIGVNAASGFTGFLIDLKFNGTTRLGVSTAGTLTTGGITAGNVTATNNNITLQLGSGRTYSTANLSAVTVGNSTLTASSGVTAAVQINPTVNQTSTAGYSAIAVNVTETGTGSGAKRLIDLNAGASGTTNVFFVDNTGAIGSAAPQTTLTGSAGTALCSQPFKGSTYKKVVIFLSGYTDTGTQTYTFPTAFTNTPFVYGLTAGVSGITATATTAKFTVTTLTGFVFLEGY